MAVRQTAFDRRQTPDVEQRQLCHRPGRPPAVLGAEAAIGATASPDNKYPELLKNHLPRPSLV